MPRPRLKKGDITLREMFILSKEYYKKEKPHGDDKKKRARLDILSVRVTGRNNLRYDRSTKQWVQVGRDVQLTTIVRTDPISYEKQDTVKVHKYPVTFLIHDIEKGIDSEFRSRAGSNYKPKFSKKGDSKEKRLKILNDNIKRGIQLQAFFDSYWVMAQYGVLYGPNTTNRSPSKKNPNLELFWSKHEYEVFTKIVYPLLTTKKGTLLNKVVKNENRQD